MPQTNLAVRTLTCPSCGESATSPEDKRHKRCSKYCFVCRLPAPALSYDTHVNACKIKCDICHENVRHDQLVDHYLSHMPMRQYSHEGEGAALFRGAGPSRIDVLTARWTFERTYANYRDRFFAKLYLKVSTELFPGRRMQIVPMKYHNYGYEMQLEEVQIIVSDQ